MVYVYTACAISSTQLASQMLQYINVLTVTVHGDVRPIHQAKHGRSSYRNDVIAGNHGKSDECLVFVGPWFVDWAKYINTDNGVVE